MQAVNWHFLGSLNKTTVVESHGFGDTEYWAAAPEILSDTSATEEVSYGLSWSEHADRRAHTCMKMEQYWNVASGSTLSKSLIENILEDPLLELFKKVHSPQYGAC